MRRFGVMSFGIGYFEDGVWVDHLAAPLAETDGVDLAPIHEWLGCCGDQADPPAPMRVRAAETNSVPREPVAAAGRSASS